ncbi:MAG: hypothetical protein V3V99_13235 [candidate division Zixibacteria bacterium]
MKKIIPVLIFIFLFTGISMGQTSKPFDIYAGGGISIPQGNASDFYKNGFNGLGAMAYNAMPAMKYFVKIELNSFKSDSTALFDVTQNNLLLGIGGILAPQITGAPLKPFGIAGAGIASISFSEGGGSISKFYFEFGAGAKLGSGSAAFFIMARYVSIATEVESFNFIPITVGIKF